MKTTFHYQPEEEKERLLSCLHYALNGLYQQNGFFILPYRLAKEPKTVYLPRLPDFPLHLLAKDILNINPGDPLFAPKPKNQKLLDALSKINFQPEPIDLKNTSRVEKNWLIYQNLFEENLFDLLPSFRTNSLNAEITWTRYGTLVSFRFALSQKRSLLLKATLRDDMGINQIAEGLLSSLLEKDFLKNNYSWLQREAITDFLLQKTRFVRFFSHPQATLQDQKHFSHLNQHYQNSAAYLKELGLSPKPLLKAQNGKILIDNHLPKINFSKNESLILEKLLNCPDETVDYYQLGDVLWPNNPDKFSLWALSRAIFKIKNKIRLNGLSPDHIKNARGEGYYFTLQT